MKQDNSSRTCNISCHRLFFFRREISTRRLFAEDSAASACPRAKQGRVSVVGGPRAEMSQNEVVSEGREQHLSREHKVPYCFDSFTDLYLLS